MPIFFKVSSVWQCCVLYSLYNISFWCKVIASNCQSGLDIETSHLGQRKSAILRPRSHLDVHSCTNIIPATVSQRGYWCQAVHKLMTLSQGWKLEFVEMDMIWSRYKQENGKNISQGHFCLCLNFCPVSRFKLLHSHIHVSIRKSKGRVYGIRKYKLQVT